jgi:hypothetical protein
MTRNLVFGSRKVKSAAATAEELRFALLVNLFIAGGNILHYNAQTGPTTRPREAAKDEARFVRAYKAISDELPGQPGLRHLKLGGGTLVLDQDTFLLVEKYVHAAPRGTQDADLVDDLFDWISSADKVGPAAKS